MTPTSGSETTEDSTSAPAPAAVSPVRRPVGRPSVASERREQILEAVERCIVRHGLERTTLARVADEACVPRSAIHHFLGNREALLRAAADRVVLGVKAAVRAGLAGAACEASRQEVVARVLDVILGEPMRDPRITRPIDELVAAAARDDYVRELLAGLYAGFVADFVAALALAFPDAPLEERRGVALAIIGLSDAASRFGDLGFDPESDRRLRAAAEQLLAGLGESRSDAPPSESAHAMERQEEEAR